MKYSANSHLWKILASGVSCQDSYVVVGALLVGNRKCGVQASIIRLNVSQTVQSGKVVSVL